MLTIGQHGVILPDVLPYGQHAQTHATPRSSPVCPAPCSRAGKQETAFACAAADRSRPTGTSPTRSRSDAVRVGHASTCDCSGCTGVKTNKHRTLQLVQNKGCVHSRDLVRHFDYSPGTARSYLSHLGRQGLLEPVAAGHKLTEKGKARLRYFDIFGCRGIACPFCKGKIGHLTCPRCGHRIPKTDARILKERDFFLVVRHAGVYCTRCSALIVDEAQARLLGITREE